MNSSETRNTRTPKQQKISSKNKMITMVKIVSILLKTFYSIQRKEDFLYIIMMRVLTYLMEDKYGVVVQLYYWNKKVHQKIIQKNGLKNEIFKKI